MTARTIGRYELVTRLASGHTGDVHLARLAAPGAESEAFAIKVVRPALAAAPPYLEVLATETPRALAFTHPNAVVLREISHTEPNVFIATELVGGQPLSTVLRRATYERDPLPRSVLLWIGLELARVIDAAHRKRWCEGADSGMLHGSLSPHAVLLTYDGRVKLRGIGTGRSRLCLAPSRARLPYRAPEIIERSGTDRRADIYSLGMLLYDAITGQVVFRRTTALETRAAILEHVLKPLCYESPGTSPDLDALIGKMTARQRADRPATAEEIIPALIRELHASEESLAQTLATYMSRAFEAEARSHQKIVAALLGKRAAMAPPNEPDVVIATDTGIGTIPPMLPDHAFLSQQPNAPQPQPQSPREPQPQPEPAPPRAQPTPAPRAPIIAPAISPAIADMIAREVAARRTPAPAPAAPIAQTASSEPPADAPLELVSGVISRELMLDPPPSPQKLEVAPAIDFLSDALVANTGAAQPWTRDADAEADPAADAPEVSEQLEGFIPANDLIDDTGAEAEDELSSSETLRFVRPPAEEPKEIGTGDTVGGRYRIGQRIAEGGMGVVYAAEHALMRKDLAVKLMRRELSSVKRIAERFEIEAQAACQLDHPNIVRITDFGRESNGTLFLVMELLQGPSLSERLESNTPIAVAEAVDIIAQILEGLDHAHAKAIVHRDLKPDNVMLVERDGKTIAKILDFGIAKVAWRETPKMRLTQTGMVFGTPRYMSPEQARAEPVDGRTDLYSVGVMLYELLTRRAPFEGKSMAEILARLLTEKPAPMQLSGCAPATAAALEALVEKALAKEPNDRFATAAEFRRALLEAAKDTPKRVHHPTDVVRARKSPAPAPLAGSPMLAKLVREVSLHMNKAVPPPPKAEPEENEEPTLRANLRDEDDDSDTATVLREEKDD